MDPMGFEKPLITEYWISLKESFDLFLTKQQFHYMYLNKDSYSIGGDCCVMFSCSDFPRPWLCLEPFAVSYIESYHHTTISHWEIDAN